MSPTLLAYGIGAIVILGMIGTGVYKIHDAGYQSAKAECERAGAAQREAESKQAVEAATGKEKEDAKAKVVYRTITRSVDKVVEKPIYRNVCLEPDGLRDANVALSGGTQPITPKPHRGVPRVDSVK